MKTFKLVMKNDLRTEVSFLLLKPVNTIGRAGSSDVVLDNPSVSKRHATIRFEGDAPTIEDSGSTNGTLVNDRRVEGPVRLKEGDELIVGEFRFHLRSEETRGVDQTITALKR